MGDGSVFISLVPSQLASARMNRVSAGVTSVPHFLTCGDQNGSFTSGVGVQNHAHKCLPEFLAYLWGLYYHANSYQGAVTKWYLPSISAPSTWNYSGLSKPHWLSFTWMVDSGNNQNPLLWESPFTSWSCCNKLLQTRWLKIRICFHHSGSQKSEINTSAALILSGGSEKTFVPGQSATFSWLPAVPGIPWLRAASLSSLLLFSHGILPSLYVSVTKFLFSYKNANCCI